MNVSYYVFVTIGFTQGGQKKLLRQDFVRDVGRLDFWTTLVHPGFLGLFGPFLATLDHFGLRWPNIALI